MEKIFKQAYDTLQPFLQMSGYQPKTTFWTDFTISDVFGTGAIKDTFKRAFKEWKTDKVYITELVMVLNWKSWQYAETNPLFSQLYQDLWGEADKWCMENLKGDDLDYFLQTTD